MWTRECRPRRDLSSRWGLSWSRRLFMLHYSRYTLTLSGNSKMSQQRNIKEYHTKRNSFSTRTTDINTISRRLNISKQSNSSSLFTKYRLPFIIYQPTRNRQEKSKSFLKQLLLLRSKYKNKKKQKIRVYWLQYKFQLKNPKKKTASFLLQIWKAYCRSQVVCVAIWLRSFSCPGGQIESYVFMCYFYFDFDFLFLKNNIIEKNEFLSRVRFF